MSPEWLYLNLPHFLSHPEGEKLEMQVLKGRKALSWSEVRPLLTEFAGLPPILSGLAMLSPRDRI